MSRRQKRKQKPSIRPKQAAAPPSQPAGKSRWLRSDIIAMVSLIIAITAILISLTIPEVRQFLCLDRPDQLRTQYIGHLLPSNGVPSNAQQSIISLSLDWESPGGDIAGTITTTKTHCSFQGTVTTDHLKLTCHNSDLSFDGYIYSDGHIKGTLSSGSTVTIWYLDRASTNNPPAAPPSTPTSSTPTPVTPTPTPSLTPTPTPSPSVTITSPADGSKVSRQVTVQGTASNIPQNEELWILVMPAGTALYFPQPGPIVVSSSGKWIEDAYIGTPNAVGQGFVLIVALADQKGSAAIRANLAMGASLGTFQPLSSMDGISIAVQVSVVRT